MFFQLLANPSCLIKEMDMVGGGCYNINKLLCKLEREYPMKKKYLYPIIILALIGLSILAYNMKNNKTVWDNLCYSYDKGVNQVRANQKTWDMMEEYVDRERFRHIQSKLRIQSRDAVWWKDACLLYFQQFSRKPIPYDIERPIHDLEDLMKIKLDIKHHN